MERLSARASGTIIASAGLVLAAFHVQSAVNLQTYPALVLIEAVVPLLLALGVAGTGALIREGRVAPTGFDDRVLGWIAVGTAALSGAVGWLFIDSFLRGEAIPGARRIVLNAATLGAVVGLVVGIYDARGQCQRRRAEQLTHINDTLRIATQEMVDVTERDELEAVVCERLTESDLYDSAWICRYATGDEFVRPAAWAGHDDEYISSLEVSVDPNDPIGQGPGGESIRTGAIQPVQDVFDEPSLEPWWDLLAEKGVESMAVVPLVGAERVHGFLSVYANRSNVFDTAEQDALSELGESIGHAIESMAARDQLAQRERELARQNRRLDEFASVVSHDLRNPLTVASGNLELVQMDREDERLDRIGDALDRMDELIDDLLTLARYGRSVDDVEAVDLRSVAENAWTTTTTEHARLRFDGDPGTVEADESRLTQVFENLFRNSVEHGASEAPTTNGPSDLASTGGPSTRAPAAGDESADFRRGGRDASVTITVGRTDDGFYVEDDGAGIPEAEHEKAFETGYSTDPDGTGFGLNIVRTIAEAHGWRVDVTEASSGGARFEFTTAGVEANAPARSA